MHIFNVLVKKSIPQISLSMVVAGALFSCQSAGGAKADSSSLKKAAEKQAAAVVEASSGSGEVKLEQRKLVVYYLHTTFRCHSCNTIERLTKEAVENGFGDLLKNGRIEIKVINIEESGNEHFVEDYKLYTKSVILSDLKNGKEASWKNLDQVWTLLRDEGKFVEYVKKEVKSYLEG